MSNLPPDLARLGDALEHAVGRAIARRRAQFRAAWALGAVVAAVPMALAAANLYVRTSDGQVPAGIPQAAPAGAVAIHPGPERDDRVPPGLAAGAKSATSAHPLDAMPPPVSARAARNYDPGVATERVDSRPPFILTLI